jgi:cephalosporin-C deacetylase-like acetyl esterase
VTGAEAAPGTPPLAPPQLTVHVRSNDESEPNYFHQIVRLSTAAGISLEGEMVEPRGSELRPARLVLTSDGVPTLDNKHVEYEIPNTVVLAITPRPSPPGSEEIKSPILGPFYMTELRAELVGKTLLGMRVDDVIRAVDYLAARPDVDAKNITVVASGHMGLVALHAAVLDKRIKHVTVDHVLESYRSLLAAPMPLDAPQDILPGVLLKYDVPDLVRVLGARVTATDWLKGTENLAGK